MFTTQSIDARLSWHWKSSHISSLIPIVLRYYLTEVKYLVVVFTLSRRKYGRKVSYNSKKRRCTTVKSHVKSSESNHLNTLNNDNVIGNSNLPHINVNTKGLFNTLITLQTETDKESSISINNKTGWKKYKWRNIMLSKSRRVSWSHMWLKWKQFTKYRRRSGCRINSLYQCN